MATTIGNTKVKVRVSALVERVEEVKAADESRYADECSAYEQQLSEWKIAAASVLRDAAKSADAHEYDEYGYNYRGGKGQLMIAVPVKPAEPKAVDPRHDQTLRMLRMVDDEQMVMTLGDDLARYL